MAKKSQKAHFKLKDKWVFIFFAVLIFILYGKSFNNGYNIDDNYVIENHPLAQKGISAIPEIFSTRYHTIEGLYFGYRPLTVAIFAIEWDVFVNTLGVKPDSFPQVGHVFNALYYILLCCLIYYTLKYLFKDKPYGVLIALLTSLIFIVHPIHTEVVLSLKNREEIISAILAIIALIQSIKYFETKKTWRLPVAVVSLTAAFLAKESAVVFLGIIPFTIVFFRSDFRVSIKLNLKKKETYLTLVLWLLALYYALSLDFYAIAGLKFNNILYLIHGLAWQKIISIFFVFYLLLVLISYKNTSLIMFRPNLKKAVWISAILCYTLAFVIDSSLIGFLCILIVNIYLTNKISYLQKNKIEAPIIKDNAVKGILKNKAIIYTFVLIVISATSISGIYYAQNKALPVVNARVYKWQNPAFDFKKTNSEKIAIGVYSLGYYTKLLTVPYPLRFYYGYKMIPDVKLFDPLVILSMLLYLFMLFYAFWSFNKRSPLSYGILFYLIGILPFANFVFPLTGIIAERLLFLPSLGFSLILAFAIIKILKLQNTELNQQKQFFKPIAILSIVLLPFAFISIIRNDDWKDRPSLYKHDIKYLENSAKANNLYANYLIAEVYGRIQMKIDIKPVQANINDAIKYYKRAIEIDSTYSNPYHNVGYIYLIIKQDYKLAKSYFDKCIEMDSTIDEAVLNRGIANYQLGQYDAALADLEEYLRISAKMPDKAYYYLAKIYISIGDSAKCENNYLKLLETNKSTQTINDEIMNYFFIKKDYSNAILAAKSQIRFNANSDKPYVDMGNFYLLSGDTINAVVNWEIAFEKFNGNYNIAMTLSSYYAGKGNSEKANYYYQKAVAYKQSHGK